MKKLTILFTIIFLVSTAMADWKADLIDLSRTNSEPEQEMLIESIVRANPDFYELRTVLDTIPFPEMIGPQYILDSSLCLDNVERPYVLYVPSGYDHTGATPLLVILHGGVGRAEIYDSTVQYAREHPLTAMAEKENWLVLFPFGQHGATWWDEVGMANIENLIVQTKRKFNIDDDRVYMGGFSDGGSAAFGYAMLNPSAFAAFLALNGHMGVMSEDGHLPTYAPNLYNTPLYVTTTDRDRLYATHIMRPSIDMAYRAGGDMLYRQHEGEHNFEDIQDDVPLMAEFLNRHPRDPYPERIVWECGDIKFGRCRWLAIDKVDFGKPAKWHKDFNVTLIDSVITFGFHDDDTHDGVGVKVSRVIDDERYIAQKIGMLAGDIIIKGNDIYIADMDSLMSFKETLKRGDDFSMIVLRDSAEVELTGTLPSPRQYLVFERTVPSAIVKATAIGNRIDITASRVGALTVFVNPDMFNLNQNIVITVNGETVFNDKIMPDLKYLLENFLKSRDRKLLYLDEIGISLK